MGCSHTPSTKQDKAVMNNYFRLKTKEIEKLRTEVHTKEEKLFLDIYKSARSDKEVNFCNLVLSQDIYFELLQILKTNEKIEFLNWTNILFQGSTDVIPQLYHILKGKSTLKKIEFDYITNLGNKKGNALYRLSRELPSLESVVLKEIELEQEDAEYLGLLIAKSNKNLIYFELESIYFFDKTEYFLDGFNQNNSIKELVLNKLNLNANNFEFLIQALTTNNCLTTLDVSNNPIGHGTEAIKKYPLVNLEKLIMNNCSIYSDDFSLLCQGIEKDKQLKHVEMNNNNIDNSAIAVKAIERLFKENKVLQVFSLKFNSIGKVDIEQYVDDKAFQRIMIDEVNQIFS